MSDGPSPEISQYKMGMQIVSPTDVLEMQSMGTPNERYASPRKTLPIGVVRLEGMKADYIKNTVDEETRGIVFTAEGTKTGMLADFANEDIFELTVNLGDVKEHGNGALICDVILPDDRIFSSTLEYDSDEHDADPVTGRIGYTNEWIDKETGEEYYFFVPADPKLLSALRFQFHN